MVSGLNGLNSLNGLNGLNGMRPTARAKCYETCLGKAKTSSEVNLGISPRQNSAGLVGMILVMIVFLRCTAIRV